MNQLARPCRNWTPAGLFPTPVGPVVERVPPHPTPAFPVFRKEFQRRSHGHPFLEPGWVPLEAEQGRVRRIALCGKGVG